jgi:hypothetical protein
VCAIACARREKRHVARTSFNGDGRLIAIENVIDDARRAKAFGLPRSLNMLIENPQGSDDTGAPFDDW